jgi:hypothetical protein
MQLTISETDQRTNALPSLVVQSETSKLVFKKSSASCDSTRSKVEWNEFFHSPHDLLKPDSTYKIHFDYHVTAQGDQGSFYALLRSASNSKKTSNWQKWKRESGDSGAVDFSVSTGGDVGDYYLIIGVHNRGAIEVRNIRIDKQ